MLSGRLDSIDILQIVMFLEAKGIDFNDQEFDQEAFDYLQNPGADRAPGARRKVRTMNFNFSEPMFRHARSDGSRLALSVDNLKCSLLVAGGPGAANRGLAESDSARPRGFVAILASRSVEAYVGVLGTGWSGDAYVPLNPKLPEDRLATLLEMIQPWQV